MGKPPARTKSCPAVRSVDEVGDCLADVCLPHATTAVAVPAERSYVEQLRRFEYQCAAAGAHRIHGHRHQYAQTRYRELTGWPAPAAGGPRSRDLTASQREADREARLTISEELGHEREQITAVYLGR